MKYFSLLVMMAVFGLATAAQAKVIHVRCQSPLLGYQMSVEGSIAPSTGQREFPLHVVGKLTLQYGPVTPKLNPKRVVSVAGQYDEVDGFKYATLGDARGTSSMVMLYVNTQDTDDAQSSFIEMKNGTTHPLNCSETY